MRHKHIDFVLNKRLGLRGSPTNALDYVLIKVREANLASCRSIPDIGQSESPRAGLYAGQQEVRGLGKRETLFGAWGGL